MPVKHQTRNQIAADIPAMAKRPDIPMGSILPLERVRFMVVVDYLWPSSSSASRRDSTSIRETVKQIFADCEQLGQNSRNPYSLRVSEANA